MLVPKILLYVVAVILFMRFNRRLRYGPALWRGRIGTRRASVCGTDEKRALLFEGLISAWPQTMAERDSVRSDAAYVDGFHLAAIAAGKVERALFIGGGGCIGPRQFAALYPHVQIDIVEIDAQIAEMATRFFWLKTSDAMRVHVVDGRSFVENAPSDSYDVIVVDAFDAGRAPGSVVSLEFFTQCVRLLRPHGALYFNTLAKVGVANESLSRVARTMMEAFGKAVATFPVPTSGLERLSGRLFGANAALVAAKAGLDLDRVRADAAKLPVESVPNLRGIAGEGHIFTPPPGATPLHDADFASTGWLPMP